MLKGEVIHILDIKLAFVQICEWDELMSPLRDSVLSQNMLVL